MTLLLLAASLAFAGPNRWVNPPEQPKLGFTHQHLKASVDSIAVLEDGGAAVSGVFDSYRGEPGVFWLARLDKGLMLDLAFSRRLPRHIAAQVHGAKVLALPGGGLLAVGRGPGSVLRLDASGTIDGAFLKNRGKAAPDLVYAGAAGPDGSVVLGGPGRLVRLRPDGGLDEDFRPEGAFFTVRDVLVQPDGKVVAAVEPGRVLRFLPDGRLDAAFAPAAAAEPLLLQPDGKILAAGRRSLVRLEKDGTLDPGFSTEVSSSVRSLAVQKDGKILAAADGLVRLNADGSLEKRFPVAGVRAVAVRGDGRILVGGTFSSYDGLPAENFAVLDPAGRLVPLSGSPAAAPEDEPMSLQGRLTRLWSLQGSDQCREALPLADRILAEDGSISSARLIRGRCLENAGDFDRALPDFSAAIASAGNAEEAHQARFARYGCYSLLGAHDLAYQDLEWMCARDDEYACSRVREIESLTRSTSSPAGASMTLEVERIEEGDRRRWEELRRWARSESHQGNYGEALKRLNEGLAAGGMPGGMLWTQSLLDLASFHRELGRPDQAEKAVREVLARWDSLPRLIMPQVVGEAVSVGRPALLKDVWLLLRKRGLPLAGHPMLVRELSRHYRAVGKGKDEERLLSDSAALLDGHPQWRGQVLSELERLQCARRPAGCGPGARRRKP